MTKIWDLGRGREIKKEIKMAWLRDSVELQILNWKRGGGGWGGIGGGSKKILIRETVKIQYENK